jgi:hypothetical protein
MVRWVQRYGVASTFADADHDDSDDGPSQGDKGDGVDSMDE